MQLYRPKFESGVSTLISTALESRNEKEKGKLCKATFQIKNEMFTQMSIFLSQFMSTSNQKSLLNIASREKKNDGQLLM